MTLERDEGDLGLERKEREGEGKRIQKNCTAILFSLNVKSSFLSR